MLHLSFVYKLFTATIFFLVFTTVSGTAQSVAINADNSTADGSAMLDIKSTSKGLLPPRLTRQQIFAISHPAAGLMVFNSTANKPAYYDGTNWRFFNDSIFTQLANGVNPDQAAEAFNAKRLAGFGGFPPVNALKWNDTLSNAAFAFAKDIATLGDGANAYNTSGGGFIFDYTAQLQYTGIIFFSLVYFYPANASVTTLINDGFNYYADDNLVIGSMMDADAKEFGMGYYNNRWYLIMAK